MFYDNVGLKIFLFASYQGFLDSQNVGSNIDDLEEYADFERPLRSEQSTKGYGTRSRKSRRMIREIEDDWELPMDYL